MKKFCIIFLTLGLVFFLSSFSESSTRSDWPCEETENLISEDDGWIDMGKIKVYCLNQAVINRQQMVTLYARELGNRVVYRVKYGVEYSAVQTNPNWLERNKGAESQYQYMTQLKLTGIDFERTAKKYERFYFNLD
jgi:hypothetical protein